MARPVVDGVTLVLPSLLRRPYAEESSLGWPACEGQSVCFVNDELLCMLKDRLRGVWCALAGWRSAQRSFIPRDPW